MKSCFAIVRFFCQSLAIYKLSSILHGRRFNSMHDHLSKEAKLPPTLYFFHTHKQNVWVESTLKHVEKNINWLSYGNLINPALNAKECLSSGEEGKVAVHEFLNESASSEDVITLCMYWDKFGQNLNCQ